MADGAQRRRHLTTPFSEEVDSFEGDFKQALVEDFGAWNPVIRMQSQHLGG
jgi:hypothetical protein